MLSRHTHCLRDRFLSTADFADNFFTDEQFVIESLFSDPACEMNISISLPGRVRHPSKFSSTRPAQALLARRLKVAGFKVGSC